MGLQRTKSLACSWEDATFIDWRMEAGVEAPYVTWNARSSWGQIEDELGIAWSKRAGMEPEAIALFGRFTS